MARPAGRLLRLPRRHHLTRAPALPSVPLNRFVAERIAQGPVGGKIGIGTAPQRVQPRLLYESCPDACPVHVVPAITLQLLELTFASHGVANRFARHTGYHSPMAASRSGQVPALLASPVHGPSNAIYYCSPGKGQSVKSILTTQESRTEHHWAG